MSTASNTETLLGNYRVCKSIGQGTFGKVRLGIHTITEQKVAIKTLQKEKIIQQSDIERVTREICILKILRHPNIIQLYEIIQTKTDIHLIMEYAEGGQLFDYIVKRKRLDEGQASKFMQQIFAGVEYIHKNGIVHRDLKPQNLLLDHNKNIKIVDFGLSNQYKPGQKLKTACGSPCYAAPEMIAGKKYECLNADIWSCGIILYAMLCGYLPFQDPNTNKLYRKIIAGDFEMPKVLSHDAKEILRNILNVNPETRFKIPQIRNSKWYNIGGHRYESKGIIIGKDHIEPNEQIIKVMEKYNVDPVQARNYVINNRHNHTTSFYYLLEIKLSRQGKLIPVEVKQGKAQEQSTAQQSQHSIIKKTRQIPAQKDQGLAASVTLQNPTPDPPAEQKTVVNVREPRQNSPLIYRPDKKPDYYVPYGKKSGSKQHSSTAKNNDSMNVSNIISSLVQANKNKLIGKIGNQGQGSREATKKGNDHFDKLEEFKLFPNKKNSSIYEPSSASKQSTSRSKYDDKSFQFRASIDSQSNRAGHGNSGSLSTTPQAYDYPKSRGKGSSSLEPGKDNIREDEVPLASSNKKRQQLSDQLRQISNKIDQEIMELRRNNNNNSTSLERDTTNSRASNDHQHGYVSTTNHKKGDSDTWFNSSGYGGVSSSGRRGDQSMGMSLPVNGQKGHHHLDGAGNSGSFSSSAIKVHSGPFNTQCIFMDSPGHLLGKVATYLGNNSIRYSEPEPFSLLMADGERISIEAIQGMGGVHLVKFSNNSNMLFNQGLLELLSK